VSILSTGRGYSSEYKAYDDTIKIFQEIGIPSEMEGKLIIREYFDNIDEIYAVSDLIVSRAGAGTIKEITTLGLPSILIPKINLQEPLLHDTLLNFAINNQCVSGIITSLETNDVIG